MITRSKALHRDQRQLLGLEEDTREEHRYNGGRFSVASVNSLDSLSPKSKVAKARHSARAAAAAAAVKAAAAAAAKAAYAASSESVTDGVEAIIAATDARLAQVAFDSELADRWGGAVDRVNIDYQACSYDRESLELAYTIANTAPNPDKGDVYDSAETLHLYMVCAATAEMLELCCRNLDPGSIEFDCVFARLSGYFFVRFAERRNTHVHVLHDGAVGTTAQQATATDSAALPPLGILTSSPDSQDRLFVETAAQPLFGPSSSEMFLQQQKMSSPSSSSSSSSSSVAPRPDDAEVTSLAATTSAVRHHGFLSPLDKRSAKFQPSSSSSSSSSEQQPLAAATMTITSSFGTLAGASGPVGTPLSPAPLAFPGPSPEQKLAGSAYADGHHSSPNRGGLRATSTACAALRSAESAERAWIATMDVGNAAAFATVAATTTASSRSISGNSSAHKISEAEADRVGPLFEAMGLSQHLPESRAVDRALRCPPDKEIVECIENLPDQEDGPHRIRPSWLPRDEHGHHHHHHKKGHHDGHGHKKKKKKKK